MFAVVVQKMCLCCCTGLLDVCLTQSVQALQAAWDVQEDEGSEPEIVRNLSGDEVDPSLIIAGGRRSRRGRAQIGAAGQRYTAHASKDSDEDSF